jgi:c-di-AMP phosphodiesterase-like protein
MLNLDNLRQWEVVKKVLKRHWMAFLGLYFYTFILIVVIISIYLTMWFTAWANFIVVILLMIALMFLYIEWLNNELDMYVITNKRIIWIDQISFLNRTVSECSLADVQEVNSRTKWVLANLFDYGSVVIQTAWNASNFHMAIVPEPLKSARQILNVVEELKKDKWNESFQK